MDLKHLVFLPGLDGTGELFADFVQELPPDFITQIIDYPRDQFLSYSELFLQVCSKTQESAPFVLVAESFSTPLAVQFAAARHQNLVALVLVAGFVTNPLGHLSSFGAMITGPIFFKASPPRSFLEHFLLGPKAPNNLVDKVKGTLKGVAPSVLSARVQEALHCDATRDLARIAIPMMYIRAEDDRLLSSSCIEEITALRADILVESVRGPHMLLQREPRETANIIASFVRHLSD